jgi:hypothetical protein
MMRDRDVALRDDLEQRDSEVTQPFLPMPFAGSGIGSDPLHQLGSGGHQHPLSAESELDKPRRDTR